MNREEMPPRIERREFSRVNAWIPFSYRVVQREECGNLRSRFLGPMSSREQQVPVESGSQPLIDAMRKLEIKVDLMIHMLTMQQEGFHNLPCKAVNISGGGIGFPVTESFPMGTVLEMKMLLSHPHPVAVYAYGKVAKSVKQTDGYYIGAQFIWMDDPVRDEIIHFVFEREREILREKRGSRGDS